MTLFKKDKYRINTIYNILSGEQTIESGLSIEKETDSPREFMKAYYVIAFIRYDKKHHNGYVEVVGDRILEVEDSEFPTFKELVRKAIEIINLKNMEVKQGE